MKKREIHMNRQRTKTLSLAFVAMLVSGNVFAQAWNYQTIQTLDAAGPSMMGEVTLEQVGGEYRFQMKAVTFDPCYKTSLKALVERTPSTITISPAPVVAGCRPERFVLKTDGTGGFREFLSDGKWRREDANRVLTLKK